MVCRVGDEANQVHLAISKQCFSSDECSDRESYHSSDAEGERNHVASGKTG